MEKQLYLACPPERDTITRTSTRAHDHLKTLVRHAVNKTVKAVGLERAASRGQGVILHAAFFAIKTSCSSRFVWSLNIASTDWECWQSEQPDPVTPIPPGDGAKQGRVKRHDRSVKRSSRLGLPKFWFVSLIIPKNPPNFKKTLSDVIKEMQQIHLVPKYLKQCASLHPFCKPHTDDQQLTISWLGPLSE